MQRSETARPYRALGVSVLVYVLATMLICRDIVGHMSTMVMHDAGDPLLTAAILHWTTTHTPYSHAWWQFPIFFPTRDALAFSEHLLGLSIIATPIEWMVGDVMTSYNVVAMLTTPLCGAAMFALVWRLTKNGAAAFLAGLAFALAPYRIAQAAHVQMLALFWAPLALLGLHAYIETSRRRWLILYGFGWMLQAMANGYCLFFFSILIALWTLWFVIAPRNWRAFAAIAIATALATIPLIPLLYEYYRVHKLNALTRGIEEIQSFSADVAAVMCSAHNLTLWGWLRFQCRPEGELFPGVAAILLSLGFGLIIVVRGTRLLPAPRRTTLLWRLCLAILAYAATVVVTMMLFGPWRLQLGPLRLSATSVRNPLLFGGSAAAVMIGIWWRYTRQSTAAAILSFYLLGGFVMWWFSLGPVVTFKGAPTMAPAVYQLFIDVPGFDGIRVPARFWALSVMCLSIAVGIVSAELLGKIRPAWTSAAIVVIALALGADGWAQMPVAAVPSFPVGPDLVGRTVLHLGIGNVQTDITTTYHAAVDDWQAVNGYSGYQPNQYGALVAGVHRRDSGVFEPLQAYGALDVLIPATDSALTTFVEQQPGARLVTRTPDVTQYRLPRRGQPGVGLWSGTRIAVAKLTSSCASETLNLVLDNVRDTGWLCYSAPIEQTVDIDLGRLATVGSVVTTLAQHWDLFPYELMVDASTDGDRWDRVWSGSVIAQTIRGAIADPNSARLTIPFAPRPVRYIRMRHPAMQQPYYWWISELEVWSGNTGVPGPVTETSSARPSASPSYISLLRAAAS